MPVTHYSATRTTGHLLDVAPNDDWRGLAACRDETPDLFFPMGNSGPAQLQTAQAKAVCNRCPVRDACLNWALTTRQDAGVWGGMSEEERRALHRRHIRKMVKGKKVTRAEMILADPEQLGTFKRLRQQEQLKASRVAYELGTNVGTVYEVDRCLAQAAENAEALDAAVSA